ncbi:nicotinate phosphoribosyltransferas-like protein [Patellaria atrata CBS 101060]|uniref:nicotinate phosphoribosyltransferase n=1 Tax=Patellaria atrata CBS 101060 TaxID=1346257 RepID=A0A9P4VRB4_9PEZI|nr:nicotinate phosphoribosyltransferas-like protein [Patellaria atrata CBS 101060]
MASSGEAAELPPAIFSLLDTDLYKLTMQCCVLKYFPDVRKSRIWLPEHKLDLIRCLLAVTYNFTNRTPHLKLNRTAFKWLQIQITKLGELTLSDEEHSFLSSKCSFLTSGYLGFLSSFRLRPADQIDLQFHPTNDTGSDEDVGDLELRVKGLWVETILYEIPLLALISEAYFKFIDRDWNYDGQLDLARSKGQRLLKEGCLLSEFGSRRRRCYHTQDLVIQGLLKAEADARDAGWTGKLSGTSNVQFAMKYGLTPVGTVAHEWFMGVAAVTNDYEQANEISLRYWVGTFGEGVLGIALTDTFGTPSFLEAFQKHIPKYTTPVSGSAATTASVGTTSSIPAEETLSNTDPPLSAPIHDGDSRAQEPPTYAQVFTGVRQDSGDPVDFIKLMRKFYDSQGITEKKTIVFSDSLNIELCLKYKAAAEAEGFQPTFGMGTFLTNDFTRLSTGKKSIPLNIVIKLFSAGGRPAVKISDNIGKNTGDKATVEDVKRRLGYTEKEWTGGDEAARWGKEGDK